VYHIYNLQDPGEPSAFITLLRPTISGQKTHLRAFAPWVYHTTAASRHTTIPYLLLYVPWKNRTLGSSPHCCFVTDEQCSRVAPRVNRTKARLLPATTIAELALPERGPRFPHLL